MIPPAKFKIFTISELNQNYDDYRFDSTGNTIIHATGKLEASMMTSWNGNIFHGTGPLCGEFTDQRWIPLTKASDAKLWCFLWSAPVQKAE